jgi:hypothetical protein
LGLTVAWLELTNDLTKEGIKRLKVGQVLMFDYEGSPNYLKIMRKERGKIWAKRLDPEKFLLPEEADEKVTVVPKN